MALIPYLVVSYESYFISSPLLRYYCIRRTQHRVLKHPYKRAMSYFLRKQAPVNSRVPFDYVLDYVYPDE